MEATTTVGTQIIERTARERVHLAWKEYRGRTYLDIRVFFLPKGEEEWQATKKGVSFKSEDVKSFVDALRIMLVESKPEEVKTA